MTQIKEQTHTPGPWEVDLDNREDDEAGECIAIVKEGHGYIAGIHILPTADEYETIKFTDEDRANARLIAAAPDLLAALKELLARADSRFNYSHYDSGLQAAFIEAKQAVAMCEPASTSSEAKKAEGGQ
jgi:hypothetical protein